MNINHALPPPPCMQLDIRKRNGESSIDYSFNYLLETVDSNERLLLEILDTIVPHLKVMFESIDTMYASHLLQVGL